MNYQNNINAYYSYAEENNKITRKERKKILILFFVLLMLLLLGWTYFNYFTSDKFKSISVPNEATSISTKSDIPIVDGVKNVKVDSIIKKTSEKNNILLSPMEKEISPATLVAKTTQQEPASLKETSKKNNSMDKNIKIDVNPLLPTKQEPDSLKESSMDKNTQAEVNLLVPLKKEINLSTLSVEEISETATSLKENTTSKESMKSTENTKKKEVIVNKIPEILYHVYIVSAGETIYDIAKKQYGDTAMYIKIVEANLDLTTPDKIYEGQELFLPIVNEAKSYTEILNFK